MAALCSLASLFLPSPFTFTHFNHQSNVLAWQEQIFKKRFFVLGHSKWKNRSKFLTPLKWLFWHWLSLLDLRECILAIFGPPGPLGGVRGGMGGSGGVPGTKNCNFFGSHIWVPNWKFLDCMNWKHFIFQVFGQKWPLRRPKMVVFGLKWVNTKVHFSQKHPL